jgi:flagellar biosynthesis chaperone FliJ
MLRQAYIFVIQSDLTESGRFKATDFQFTNSGEKDGLVRLSIQYRFEPKYEFSATIQVRVNGRSSRKIIEVSQCPGKLTENEQAQYKTENALRKGIREWSERIYEELIAAPINREIAQQQKQLEELMQQFDGLGDEYFTKQEAEHILHRLEDLEKKLQENLEKNIEDKELMAGKIEEIKMDMEVLRNSIGSLKKKGWTGSLVARVLDWGKDPTNRKILTSGAKIAKDLLLEAGERLKEGPR